MEDSDAKSAAHKGVVGAAASAMTINFSGCAVTNHTVTASKCVKVDNCNDLGSILQGGIPDGYTVADGVIHATLNGQEASCSITQTGTTTPLTFTGISAGN